MGLTRNKASRSFGRNTPKFDARLIIDAPSTNANICWATGFWAPDPAVFIEVRGRRYLILRDLEVDRARKTTKNTRVLAASDLECEIRKKSKTHREKFVSLGRQNGGFAGSLGWMEMVDYLFRGWKVKSVLVPANFGIVYADVLRALKYRVHIKSGPFYEDRALKTLREIRMVRSVMRITEKALRKGIDLIQKSSIRKGKLVYQGVILTSEYVRDVIHRELLAGNCIADLNTIVACGGHTEDPHDVGRGSLKANQAIILDVFPRSLGHGYYGDITRTIVKGRASKKLKEMYQAVFEAVRVARAMYRPNVPTPQIYQAVKNVFESRNFPTGKINGRRQGFIHGVGHGVGLDIHEEPSVGSAPAILKAGHLITLEPGLYYHRIGGVRIEDLYYITRTGARRITQFPHLFEV